VQHDIMVLYTQATLTKHGAGTNTLITQAIANANAEYAASGVGITLRLVASGLSPVSETGSLPDTLSAFSHNGAVMAQRDAVAADLVVLLTQDSNWCGWAYLWYEGASVEAYAAVHTGCLPGRTFTHEIGHLNGLAHNMEDAGGFAPRYPYGYGYRVYESNGFRDIMAYQCPNVEVPRVGWHSTPLLSFNGLPTGIDSVADASRALNDNAAHVASYRVGSARPMPPTNFRLN
jgi:hypothetical protein